MRIPQGEEEEMEKWRIKKIEWRIKWRSKPDEKENIFSIGFEIEPRHLLLRAAALADRNDLINYVAYVVKPNWYHAFQFLKKRKQIKISFLELESLFVRTKNCEIMCRQQGPSAHTQSIL